MGRARPVGLAGCPHDDRGIGLADTGAYGVWSAATRLPNWAALCCAISRQRGRRILLWIRAMGGARTTPQEVEYEVVLHTYNACRPRPGLPRAAAGRRRLRFRN